MDGARSARRRGTRGGARWLRRGAVTLGSLGILAPGTGTAAAQAAPGVQIRADNDGFNLWRRPAQRSDGEYTNGIRLSVEAGRAPLWRRWAPRAAPCAAVRDSAPRCSSATFAVGQDMYTPAEDSQPYTYKDWQRQRPYAGWLYATMRFRTVRRSTLRSLGVTVGVTGPPSLADRTQRRAHEMMAGYTTVPVGWDTQVRFEPGIIVSARQEWMLLAATIKGVHLLDASVGLGAAAGNVLTNAEASGRVRVGINLSHPWRRARRRGPAEVSAELGVRGQVIAHSIFLDGNTVNPDRRVDRVPTVGDVYGSVGLRLGALVLAYAVTERGREYDTGPRSHTFSSVILGIGGIPSPLQ